MGGHPTAAMVYDYVHVEHPTISRSTVYRVLARMTEEGKVLRLELAGGENRYDGQLHPHGHARCRICGTVADIPPVDMEVVYRGLCPTCRKYADKHVMSAERRQ